MSFIDLRSDTVTQPSEDMKKTMFAAKLGDDVFGEDPSIIELQEFAADFLGKEAALFCPSAVMTNQIAVGLHMQPGDQILGHPDNHLYRWEQGAIARLWGASYKEVRSKNPRNSVGVLEVEDLKDYLQPDDIHYPRTKLICLENTLNFGGGLVYPQEKIESINKFAQENKLKMHLDGARLFNAHVASGVSVKKLCASFDTISICLSKGLGCPVGSLLLGAKEEISLKALRLRKLLGGGMRQAGLLAAAGTYALKHNIQRLKEDHRAAQSFAQALLENDHFDIEYPVETNMVWFKVSKDAPLVQEKLKKEGLKVLALTDQLLRAVFHLDVNEEQVRQACELVRCFR